jgi:hypothetical protein
MHRLTSGGRQIDHRETAMDQCDAGVVVKPALVTVWPAMLEAVIHRIGDTSEFARRYAPIWIDDAGYATHEEPAIGAFGVEAARFVLCNG